jgi:integrase
MFMRRRGDPWQLRVYLGRDPVTGKQRYASRTVRGGKRVAQRLLAEMVTDAERGLSVRTNATAGRVDRSVVRAHAMHARPRIVGRPS